MPTRSQGPPCRMEACCSSKSLNIMDSFKPLFCCVDGCISAQEGILLSMDRGLKDRLCRMEACVALKVTNIHGQFKPLFVVWMDAFSAQRRYPAVHGQVGGIVLLSRDMHC
ncbi:hypothetical protein TNCT_403411 [Trichonephila clavata]|uniref:Uncharacterized protein n=1 Tax=Trichonephila clavata TaxID=2740835 RepID=A0A8X6JCX7_TRICU|nr:hypothetical protein TNCT_403411 [Trichonephila clavata]